MTSSCPCRLQLWPTVMCPFSTASWAGCGSLPVQPSDDTNTHRYGDTFHYWWSKQDCREGTLGYFLWRELNPLPPAIHSHCLKLTACLPPPLPKGCCSLGHCQPPVTTAATKRALFGHIRYQLHLFGQRGRTDLRVSGFSSQLLQEFLQIIIKMFSP